MTAQRRKKEGTVCLTKLFKHETTDQPKPGTLGFQRQDIIQMAKTQNRKIRVLSRIRQRWRYLQQPPFFMLLMLEPGHFNPSMSSKSFKYVHKLHLSMQSDDLIRESLIIYSKFNKSPNLVSPSIPILFFGDSQKYASSKLKVVTVGLNPSKEEFPDDRFSRFPEVESIYKEILEGKHLDKYLSALNNYFRNKPYRRWFDRSFEPILNGMGASYYDSQENTALHTDLCSPLATNPTWNRLKTDVKVRLKEDGNRLWHSLMRRLDPDAIIISVKEDYLQRIRNVHKWKTVYKIYRKNPYSVKMGTMLMESKISRIFFGKAAQQPFGTVSTEDKRGVGQEIRRIIQEEATKGARTFQT